MPVAQQKRTYERVMISLRPEDLEALDGIAREEADRSGSEPNRSGAIRLLIAEHQNRAKAPKKS